MFLKFLIAAILFPFKLFGGFVNAFMYPPKPEEDPEKRELELRREIAKLQQTIRNQGDLILFLQHQLEEQSRLHQLEIDELNKKWRAIIQDLQRQLSFERAI